MPEGMRGDNFNFINAYAITLFMVCELQHTYHYSIQYSVILCWLGLLLTETELK